MKFSILIQVISCLLNAQMHALDDSNAARMYVIADSILIHSKPDETSELVATFSKGDFLYYQERFGEDETFAHINGHSWLFLEWTLGSGWARQSSLLDENLWKGIQRIPPESLATEKSLESWLTNPDQAGFESSIITISPNRESIIVAMGTVNNYGGLPCHFQIGKGLVSRLDAYEWLKPQWSEDSRYVAAEPQIPPDGWFDQPLSLYDTQTGDTTFVNYCQYISEVEFYMDYLIWLGFENDPGKVMIWDYLDYDYGKLNILPALWAYNLASKEKIKLLVGDETSITRDEKDHEQAKLKPAESCPELLKKCRLFKKYNGNNALLWFDTME